MKTSTHLIANGSIALALNFSTNIETNHLVAFIAWGGIIIDVDHPILYFSKYNTLKIKDWVKIQKSLAKKLQAELYFFHSPEINLTLMILGVFYPFFLWIFLSSLIHITLDIISHYAYHKNFKFLRKWSIIYNIIKH